MSMGQMFASGLSAVWGGGSMFLMVVLAIILGTIFGALPGVSATMAVALGLTFTYTMGPVPAIVFLVAIYCSSITGGSITAILFKIPGVPSSAPTTFDGYPMAQRGEAGKALGVALIASAVGGLFSALVMFLLSEPLAKAALAFGQGDLFAITFLGLSILVVLDTDHILTTIISGLLANAFGGFFNVPGINSGCTVNNYKFPLYINLLDGIMGMLEEYGYRLSIHAEKTAAGEPVQVTVEAVEMEMTAGTQNEDSPYTITVRNDRMGINHLICLGSGSLRHRDRIDLYIDQSGNVTETQYFTGFEERTAIYDYASVESHADLKSSGIKRLRELASTKKIEVNIKSDTDAGHRIEIGDNVRAALRGDTVVTKVIQKVVKISNGVETVSYKTSSEQ